MQIIKRHWLPSASPLQISPLETIFLHMYDSVFAPHVRLFALTFLLFWFCMCVQFALWGLVGLIQALHFNSFFTGLLRYTQSGEMQRSVEQRGGKQSDHVQINSIGGEGPTPLRASLSFSISA